MHKCLSDGCLKPLMLSPAQVECAPSYHFSAVQHHCDSGEDVPQEDCFRAGSLMYNKIKNKTSTKKPRRVVPTKTTYHPRGCLLVGGAGLNPAVYFNIHPGKSASTTSSLSSTQRICTGPGS